MGRGFLMIMAYLFSMSASKIIVMYMSERIIGRGSTKD